MVKRYVLDTSVLIHDPISMFQFEDNDVIIPATTIEELNNLKDNTDRLRGLTAQTVLKFFDELTVNYPTLINTGIPLDNGGKLLIEMNHVSFEKMSKSFDEKTNDNKIIAVAKNYQEEDKNSTVILVSNDVGMRVKARSLGILAEGYDSDRLVNNLDEVYKGFTNIKVTGSIIDEFFSNGFIDIKKLNLPVVPFINEFIVLESEYSSQHVAVGRVKNKKGKMVLEELFVKKDKYIYGICPKDLYQLMCFELLMDDSVPFVSIIGKAGTGKTLLSLATGLSKVQDEKIYKRVLALRTLVTVGKKEVGFLPGDLAAKLHPFMQPFYDNLEFLFDTKGNPLRLDSILMGMENQLQIESTGFMRGRTLPKQFIIVDEAQNLTKHEVKTIVTRVGEGSKVVLMGDPGQIDDPYLDSVNNGLIYATERMKHTNISGSILLTGKSHRSDLAEIASQLL